MFDRILRRNRSITRKEQLEHQYRRSVRRFARYVNAIPKQKLEEILEGKNKAPHRLEELGHQVTENEELLRIWGFSDDEIRRLSLSEHVEFNEAQAWSLKARLTSLWKTIDPVQKAGCVVLIFGTIVLLVAALALYRDQNAEQVVAQLSKDLYSNIVASAFGTAITIFVLDRLYRIRNKEERKRWLLLQLRHPNPDIALQAFMEINHSKMLRDGSLEGEELRDVNLPYVIMQLTRLRGVDFYGANLEGASFVGADLKGVNFMDANLKQAKLNGTDLRNVSFLNAKLQGATLWAAKLKGARFKRERPLTGYMWKDGVQEEVPMWDESYFDQNTILPDGRKWSPEIDMSYYTDPDYPGGMYEPPKNE